MNTAELIRQFPQLLYSTNHITLIAGAGIGACLSVLLLGIGAVWGERVR